MLRLLSAILITSTILTLAFSCQELQPMSIESGVSKTLADYRKATIKNVEYEVAFAIPDSLETTISGGVTIKFDLAEINQPVVLDFENTSEELIILLNEKEIKIDFEFKNNHIIIPTKHLKLGKNTFTLAFTAGEQALNRNADFMYTLFVPNKAATAFPCFDQPNIKAKYQLTLSTPKSWTALANYPLINKTEKERNILYEYEQTPPISTYLFASPQANLKQSQIL